MKQKTIYLRSILFIALISIGINIATDKIAKVKLNTVEEPQSPSFKVTATMYYAVADQCDKDPLVTAGMFKIDPRHASEHKWIAMSRDLIKRWKGEFNYGDLVEIKGAGHKDGIYKVVDTMNKRFTNRIDFLETKGTKPYKFENVTLTKILCKQENLLASL